MKQPSRALLLELGVNLLGPWLVYRLCLPTLGEFGALVASGIPPALWALAGLVRTRRLDALSLLVLLGIVLSAAVSLLGGEPRLLLLRESLVTGSIGLAFLISLALGRPLVFYLARATVARESAEGSAGFEAAWRARPTLAASIRLMTLVWGLGLCAEFALRAWLVMHLPIERVLLVSPLVGYGAYGALAAWTLWYRLRLKRGAT
ncbi:VC0807 family protein [Thiomonas sp. FB-6]|uniref:VC0807 family protein n=1 Tax=Thiomonas sp. FB-6 TaxID=1158291 RepID=UPI0003768FC4|nr:VC0807 family protein [Thiomonas sp. FB-6]